MKHLLVAHGTRRPSGIAMIGDLADQVSRLLNHRIHVAFVDVLGPTPSEVLCNMTPADEPVIVVPAFLSRGYHVRTDLPAHVAASGRPHVIVTPPLGPGPHTARLLVERLCKAGWHPGDSVILAAAGTSDPAARTDLHTTATLLSALTGSRVELALAAIGDLSVADAVAKARHRSSRPVVVASYLLADGLFQQQLRNCGADIVTDPLANDPRLARLIANRFQRVRTPLAV
jgi:sirohydrochlorin ferrochelatase